MKRIIWIVFLMLAITSCQSKTTKGGEENPQGSEHITSVNTAGSVSNLNPTEFDQKMKEKPGILLDVRTPGEFSAGHLDGALNIDYNSASFETEIEKLDKTQTVYVYCQKGGRSAGAADILSSKGFQVINMTGGYSAWQIKH